MHHSWDLTPKQAIELQRELSSLVVTRDQLGEVRQIAGVDVGFEDGGQVTRAAVAVLSAADLRPLSHAIARQPTRFPYVPGLLSFREVPAVLEALAQLDSPPDLILCDGHGYAHPRRFGIACHLGLLSGIPCIGVGKSRLLGAHAEVPAGKGQWCALRDRGETIGAVLRSRVGVQPIYVSAGHRICLETAIDWVMRCVTRYRLPETTRLADRLASNR